MHDVRMATIAYRVVISVVLFGIIGYALGFMGERIYRELIAKIHVQEPQTDIVIEEHSNDEVVPESEFSPFASDSFEQISRPKE